MAGFERHIVAAIGAVIVTAPILCVAQTSTADSQQGAPAESRSAPLVAGRISFVDGSLSVLPPGAKEWSKASLDRPVNAGDQLWSDKSSRAEVDLGGLRLRLSANSELSLLDLSEQTRQIGIGVGTMDLAWHDADVNQSFEVDSPQVAISIQRSGDYRINVDLDGTTTVLVRSGALHLNSRSGEGISLRDGQGVVFASDGTLDIADARTTDGFDRWCAARDVLWQQAQLTAQTSSAPPDLNDAPAASQPSDAGQWNEQPDYGQVWFPSQMPDGYAWAPYRSGRWAWVPRWGWIWIDKVHSHGSAPPTSVTHRPLITSRNSAAPAANVLPHIVASAPAPRRADAYVPIPSPIGPTIYARDVRPDDKVTAERSNVARDTASHTALLNAPVSARSPVVSPAPPRITPPPSRETPIPRAAALPADPPPVPASAPRVPRTTPKSTPRAAPRSAG